MNFRIVVAACITVFSVAATPASAKKMEPEICKIWNTAPFFKVATPRDVSQCVQNGGADVHKPDEHGFTTLHNAATISKSRAFVEALIKEGADPKARSGFLGVTPLHRVASFNNTPGIAAALIEAGADPNAPDKLGLTPLHTAAAFSDAPEVVAELLKKGADPNARSGYGLLRLSSLGGKIGAVFLQGYSDPNPRTRLGFTPLHQAAALSKSPAIITLLLDAGADVNIRDKSGKTPWDYAKENPALKGTRVLRRLG